MPETPQEALQRLLRILHLTRLSDDSFRGEVDQQEGRLFGGLILSQAVIAAGRTVNQGVIHSLHAYFLRAGKPIEPVTYNVERLRDGRTFTTHRVTAIQAGDAIFEASVSFTIPETGISHQKSMPDAPAPESQPSWWESIRDTLPPAAREMMTRRGPMRGFHPLDMRSVRAGMIGEDNLPHRTVWGKPTSDLPEDPLIHAAAMAYFSDSGLVATVGTAYGMWGPGGSTASLDHAMWWHHPPRFNDWLLYVSDSPAAHAARGLIFAHMYSREGALVASVAQEGLFRPQKT
ncbi:MAG: thioesterase family protein [Dehalococcoidia bacterium]|nr:thioesterase family protein [Dehalococcoidia bacterium]